MQIKDKSLYELIREGFFEPKTQLPSRPTKPHLAKNHTSKDVETYMKRLKEYEHSVTLWNVARDDWVAEERDLQAKFKVLALRYCNIDMQTNPKAERAWIMAWERGHSGGYGDVLEELSELAELIT
jgi:hypothetical protein